jgi:hypothetical protein
MTSGQFAYAAAHMRPFGRKTSFVNGNYMQSVTFDNFDLKNSLGTASMTFAADGTPLGFFDLYDMDPKPWGTRSPGAEVMTRFGNAVGSTAGAKPFEIGYPCV